MLNKVLVFTLAGVLTLGAKVWVNAVRDPGAELGQGDWKTGTYEFPEGSGLLDSARVSEHDSSRAYEGKFSFLTDTEKDPNVTGSQCRVWCEQQLTIPKAVKDLDSCSWVVYAFKKQFSFWSKFFISFRTNTGKTLLWCSGSGASEGTNDTLYSVLFSPPDSGKWQKYSADFEFVWGSLAKWPEEDTIVEVLLLSRGEDNPWAGQDVSWDNIYLKSVAYYDYAAKSIDSDSLADKSYTPIVTFANEGIKADKAAWVYAEILEGSTRVYIDSQQVSIPKESSQQVTFANWTVPHSGSYTLRAFPIQELDELSTDDTLQKSLTGTGIAEPVTPVTHPSLDVTLSSVKYSLPFGEQGTITLYDPAGRKMESIKVTGSGSVSLKARLATGVYFIRLETSRITITRKAVVLR